MPLAESQSCCTNPSSVSQFLLQHDEGNVLWNLIPRLRVAYRTDEFIDFFYSYIGNPEFFSSYVGFFYGGIDAKKGERPLFTVFLFHSYVGIHTCMNSWTTESEKQLIQQSFTHPLKHLRHIFMENLNTE